MTSTLWVGILTIVLMLELIRIGMTTWVLIHILESHPLRRPGESTGQVSRGVRSARARYHREALTDPTLTALRGAMDEVAIGRPGRETARAIEALDRYAAALVDEQAQVRG
jgi:hypothetical protein